MSGGGIALLALGAHLALQITFVLRALLRPHREAASRAAWILVILTMPAIGMAAYVLFGDTNIGRKRLARYRDVIATVKLRASAALTDGGADVVDARYRHLFRVGSSINGLAPMVGNTAEPFFDTDAIFDALVADIDAAERTVHLLFYIWLDDRNGSRVAEAAMRAARRGVAVRVMVDDLGSRGFIASRHWSDMKDAGVHVVSALPVRPIFLHPIKGRVDLRNHRKIVVIDDRIGYCGSANCADAEFRVKARFAPWVDVVVRFEGPIAAQMQYIFVQDWMAHSDDDLTPLISDVTVPAGGDGVVAQVIGTGPTVRATAMPEMFEALIHAARRELIITTPYFVPSDGIQSALCAAGRRGVRTVMILPRQNDSWIVAAASRSYYPELVDAGVRVFEYPDGLLHAKTLTVDGEIALVGSANLDRRSFELNYENNVLLQDAALTARIVAQQEVYLAASHRVDAGEIASWKTLRRMWNNAVAMMGPVL
ncbi:cardiolipin synthase [Roseibacterium sp. SDUM158016]|uniref:cardiolipin synthase n=1 Tax=Roseicyclus sediminis TaxID=2980997 RepID=UPI0021CE5558|nr:cardiolipin synthase [Roseibacterium sp. SDUM158016]MCU4653250.1 cardiolipin synthase [Roseibacterium sp. SDUM158016]